MATAGKAFFDRQIQLLAQKDIDGIADGQYAEDAVLLGFDFEPKVGRETIREHFKEYLAQLGYIKLLSTDKWRETDDSIFFEATVDTAGGKARVFDAFVLKGGQATFHFTGLLSFTPKG